jgi:small-conductance mechanosensitive channel
MIILYETIVSDPLLICGGTEILYDSDVAFALIISYRSLFSTLALIIGAALLVVGAMMLQMLSDPDLGASTGTYLKIMFATSVGTFGLIAQAIYYLVTTASRVRQSIYLSLSILLIDEVIPALVFLFIVSVLPKEGGLKSRVAKMRSTGSKSSGGKSSGNKSTIPSDAEDNK